MFDICAKLISATALTLTLGLSPAATANQWPRTAGWDIFEGEDYCGLGLEYEGKGDTQLLVSKYLDGRVILMVTNYGWSAKKGQAYELEFHLDDAVFSGGKAIGTGESYERRGFVTGFGADFFPTFVKASGLKIFLGETLVDNLSLKGSAAASAVLERCLAKLRSQRAAIEREKQRFAHIPDDPFAGAAVPRQPPTPRGSPAAWITSDDYPSAARLQRRTGAVVVELTIAADGRVSGCDVTVSSGSDDLDNATCNLVSRRARFNPATNAKGEAVEAKLSQKFTWSLPQ